MLSYKFDSVWTYKHATTSLSYQMHQKTQHIGADIAVGTRTIAVAFKLGF